jgi:hypothetical protein
MTRCPNCRDAMTVHEMPAHASTRSMEVEACASCNLFWFDGYEHMRLTPQAVLDLFRFVGSTAGTPRRPLASNFDCPRCGKALAFSHDLQRTTRFNYWRCVRDRGQLMTYQQFLRAKNFVRAPSPDELARLRATVRQIACSQCGAPIDLARDPACTHCGSPIALVDPDGVAKAIADLAAGRAASPAQDSAAVRAALTDAQIEAIFDLERMRSEPPERDLLAVGLAAAGAWLATRLASL